MKFHRWLSSCALALSLVPSFAKADDAPPPAVVAQHRVEAGLVKPLTELEANASKFSRSRRAPRERRVRILQTTASLDKAGRPFMTFAVDVRFAGGKWSENDVVGCAYTANGDLFVKKGDAYRPAAFLLGKNADAVADVCVAAPAAATRS